MGLFPFDNQAKTKSEIRISKSETNETLKSEIQKLKSETNRFGIFCFLIIWICFKFQVSGFGFFWWSLFHSTGHRFTFQMSAAYSAIVLSLENFPEPATFKIALRDHPTESA